MSVLLKSVCKCMERIAPLRLAEKWDNVSLGLDASVLENQLMMNSSRLAFYWVRVKLCPRFIYGGARLSL